MIYLNYKLGELIVNNKKYQLTKIQSKIVFILMNNKLNTYEEIYSYIYNIKVNEVNRCMTKCIYVHMCRLRKLGLKIETKYNYGCQLKDKICLI